MVTTPSRSSDPLPDEVEGLINRRLALMRREEEMQLNGITVAMWTSVGTDIRAGLDSSRSKAAIPLRTLAAYRDAAAKLLRVTDDWPDAVWKTIEPILDYVSITPNHGESIARLLYTHAWPIGDVPWTASWLGAERFAEGVQREMGRYGLSSTEGSAEFERQLSLESSKVQVAFANNGRIALGKAQCALEEYLLARRARDVAARDMAGNLQSRETRAARQNSSDSAPAAPEAGPASRLSAIAGKTAKHVEADGTRIGARKINAAGTDDLTYIPYPKAMKMLREFLGATPAELAVWVSFGDTPGCGGITAFLEASITDNPRTLRFDSWSEAGFDYIAPLMGAWFVLEDVMSFQPQNRYIEYLGLVGRWQSAENILDVHSYISAKVREDRLHEVHPVTGHSQLSLPDYEYPRPARETTLLDLVDVETIEREEEIKSCIAEKPAPKGAADGGESCLLDNSRRESRKRESKAMYQAWQEEYQRLRESNPDKSKTWCARQIERMDIACYRDAETIRRKLR